MVLNRLKVTLLIPYLIGGVFMWFFMLHSGVHATITGVLLAIAIPFGDGSKDSISISLQHFLHKPVAFFILPLFALANTAIVLSSDMEAVLTAHYSIGIAVGLIVGKPLGIFLLSFLAVKTKICKLPKSLDWKLLFGAGCLGGIGFTMSIFVTLLAFDDATIINNAKFIILLSSLTSGILGFLLLKFSLKKKNKKLAK